MVAVYRVFGIQSWTQIPLKVFLIGLLTTWISCTNAGDHHAVETPSPRDVLAIEGGDAILPCQTVPPVDMERDAFQWTRPDRSDLDPKYVYLRQDGRYIAGEVNPAYRGRVTLLTEELPDGNISVRLSRVQLTDNGTYQCYAPYHRFTSLVNLLVGSVSQPVISANGLSLSCASGCWFPQPEVFWLDSNGARIPPGPPGTSRTSRTSPLCYEVQSNLTLTGPGQVTCRVHLPHWKYSVDATFLVVDFDGGPTGAPAIGWICVLIGIIILLAAAVVYLLCRRRKRDERRRFYKSPKRSSKDSGITVPIELELTRSIKGSMQSGLDSGITVPIGQEVTGSIKDSMQSGLDSGHNSECGSSAGN